MDLCVLAIGGDVMPWLTLHSMMLTSTKETFYDSDGYSGEFYAIAMGIRVHIHEYQNSTIITSSFVQVVGN